MLQSRRLWKEAELESGMKVYTRTGGLDFGEIGNKRIQAIISAAKVHEVQHEVLTSRQVTEKFPIIKLPDNYIGVFSESSGVLNATKAVCMFQQLARQNGCKLMDKTPITEIIYKPEDTECPFEIRSPGGNFKAKNCVVTAGAWTQRTLSTLKVPENLTISINLPLQPVQTTVVYWNVNNNGDAESYSGKSQNMPVFIDYQVDIYGLPALEYPTLVKVQTHYGNPIDPDKRDYRIPEGLVETTLAPYIRSHLPGVSVQPVTTESCMYTMTPDGDFIVDKVDQVPGLYVGCGFSGHGFKLSPAVGKILSEFVLTGANPFPEVSHHLSINRFH